MQESEGYSYLKKIDFPSSSLEMPYNSKPNTVSEEAKT